ncbi:outer membrane beta-barrel protein [Penaeicola halotolerans]|uniref:outer membrane beta-barrel protein n=1 Tax=Penaeicola halotolerans TaxID=2793196 RepID=UPI001CF87342|nr:outer membrane beta-barrel protein [Penaeicola halotolerans]
MKKILLLCALSFCLAGVVQAQISVGAKGGLNVAKLGGPDVVSDNTTGWHAGLYAKFKLLGLGLQPELLYSQVGGENFNNSGTDIDLSYITAPILLVFSPIPGGFVDFQLGPQFGYLVGDQENLGLTNLEDNFRNGEVSGVVGVQANLRGINAGVRYVHGFTAANSEADFKNRLFQFYVGFRLFGN